MSGIPPTARVACTGLVLCVACAAVGWLYFEWQSDQADEIAAPASAGNKEDARPGPFRPVADPEVDIAVYVEPIPLAGPSPANPRELIRPTSALQAVPPLDPEAVETPAPPVPLRPANRFLPAGQLPPQDPPGPANPALPKNEEIKVGSAEARSRVQITPRGEKLTLVVRDAPLNDVLGVIAEQQGLNLVTSGGAPERVSLTLTNVTLDQALFALLTNNGYTWTKQGNIIFITKVNGEAKNSPFAQGRMLRVFDLNYIRASDADKVAKGLLSPVGQSFAAESSPLDKLRTREQLVIEDLPSYVARIEEYLCQVDVPPPQVLVEANILQVTLKENSRHGVNFKSIANMAGTEITFGTQGFADPLGVPMAFMQIDGSHLESFIDCIKSTNDVKTLASPKVFVLNGQEAKIQIGGKIGYLETTTTQTSTLQSVNFLPIGVILNVTPFITRDGQVLLQVAPEVSTGRINPTTKLPDSETTTVNTRVMIGDGQAIVIGGLIKENDNENVNKVLGLGDIFLGGWLFRNQTVEREKNEIIITLRTFITPYPHQIQDREDFQLFRANSPVVRGALCRAPRPWEAHFTRVGENCCFHCLGAHGWSNPFGLGSECDDDDCAYDDWPLDQIHGLPPVEELPPWTPPAGGSPAPFESPALPSPPQPTPADATRRPGPRPAVILPASFPR